MARGSLLVLASGNAGKLREMRELLSGLPLRVEAQAKFALTPVEESGASFAENALLKARAAALATGAAVIADDSGLEVDALGGAPGVRSARFAGAGADDAANNAKLLASLAGLAPERRSARYRCVLIYLAHPGAEPFMAEGLWEGVILDAPRGRNGFGYDPYFWLPRLAQSAAELAAAEKNRLSHRGQAMRTLRGHLEAQLRGPA